MLYVHRISYEKCGMNIKHQVHETVNSFLSNLTVLSLFFVAGSDLSGSFSLDFSEILVHLLQFGQSLI